MVSYTTLGILLSCILLYVVPGSVLQAGMKIYNQISQKSHSLIKLKWKHYRKRVIKQSIYVHTHK